MTLSPTSKPGAFVSSMVPAKSIPGPSDIVLLFCYGPEWLVRLYNLCQNNVLLLKRHLR